MMGYEAYHGSIDTRQEQQRNPNFEEAYRWFLLGAKLGGTECCADLCMCYHTGLLGGIPKNPVKVFKWAKKAAEQGHPKCIRLCGECHLLGEGVEQSNSQAIYWFEKSLELEDNEDVRNHLQRLYQEGS
jgi:TPR repeat protein